MAQVSTLLIKIDSEKAKRDADELSQNLRGIFDTGNKASNSMDGFGNSTKAAGSSAQSMASDVNRSTKALDDQVKRAEMNTVALKELAKTVAGFIAIDKGIAMADGYTQMAAQIRNASESAAEYNRVQKHLLETANTTYRSLQEAQQVYLDVGGALKAYGATTEQALRITDSLSFSFTHNATAADKAATATNAFMKSIYEGRVSGDSWRSMLSAIPSIVDDMSKSLDISKEKILTLGNAGEITIKQLNTGLDQSRENSERLANAMDNSFVDGMTTLINSVTVFLGKLNMATGATNSMAAGLGLLGENIDKIAILGGIAASIYAGRLASAFVLSAQKAAWNTAAIITQTGAMNASVTAARGLYLALGGPVGLAIAATGAVASMYFLRDSAKEVTPVLDRQNKSVQDLTEEYIKLDEASQRQAVRDQIKEVDDLTTTYDQQTLAMAGLGRVVMNNTDLTQKDREAAKELYDQYIKGKINADQFASRLNNLGSVSKELKERIDKQASATTESNKAMNEAVRIRDAFLGKSQDVIRANNDEAKSIDNKRRAQQELNAEQNKAMDRVKLQLDREKYIKHNVGLGWTRDKAEYMADLRADAKMGFTAADGKMPDQLLKMGEAGYQLKKDAEARTKAEQETTKELKKQADLSKMVGASALSGLRIKSKESVAGGGVKGYTAEFAKLAQSTLGNELVRFTAFNDLYHKGTNSKHATGNAFDLTVKSAKDAQNSIAKLNEIAQQYGFTIKAINEYANPSSRSTGGHIHVSVLGFKGDSESLKDAKAEAKLGQSLQKDLDKEAKEQAKNRIQLETAVADGVGKIRAKLAEDLKDIDEAGFSDTDATALKAKYQAQADNEIAIAQYALKTKLDDYKDFRRSEEELLEKSFKDKKFAAMRDLELTASERGKAVALLEEQLQKEKGLLEVAKVQREYSQSLELRSRLNSIQDRIAMAQAPKSDRERLALTQNQDNAYRDNDNEYAASLAAFSEQLRNKEITEADHLRRVEEAQRLHAETKYAISLEYKQKEDDLLQSQKEAQIQLWGGILSNAQTTFSQLTQSMKSASGEQSAAYKTMFALQQGFSVASSLVAAYSAYTQAFADPSAMTLPQKIAGAATVMASVMPAIATITSTKLAFADGGLVRGPGTGTSDSIPAWLSNEEFVIKAKAVKSIGVDNLNRMNKTGELPQIQREARQAREIGKNGGSSSAVIQPQIIINTPPGMTARTEQRDGKTYVTIEDVRRELGDQIGRSNSELNKGMKQQYEMKPRR